MPMNFEELNRHRKYPVLLDHIGHEQVALVDDGRRSLATVRSCPLSLTHLGCKSSLPHLDGHSCLELKMDTCWTMTADAECDIRPTSAGCRC